MGLVIDVTLFANIHVNDTVRFERLKYSIQSLRSIEFKNYVVNVRGSFCREVIEWLEGYLHGKDVLLESNESKDGWMHDSRALLQRKELGRLVFVWVEDHALVGSHVDFCSTVREAISEGNERLMIPYSWYCDSFRGVYQKLVVYKDRETFEMYKLDRMSLMMCCKKDKEILSMLCLTSLFSSELLVGLLGFQAKWIKWSHMKPFNFEYDFLKSTLDRMYVCLPKQELCASIDDDKDVGYSLQSRGLYSLDISREDYRIKENRLRALSIYVTSRLPSKLQTLSRGIQVAARYLWFTTIYNISLLGNNR